jgi:hypothetical protein
MLSGSLISLAWILWPSTAKLESGPAGAPTVMAQNLAAGASCGESQALVAACVPFLDIVPSQDGAALFISVDGLESCGTICVNTDKEPGMWPDHDQRCCTTVPCVITLVGLTPRMDVPVSFSVTSTLGLEMMVDSVRAYVPASTARTIRSLDGNVQLTLVSTDTIPFDTYVAVTTNYVPPGPDPLGHRFVGSAYSVRAAGALLVTDEPMSLRLDYNETSLAGADPHNLSVFAWDAYHERWDDLGGWLFYDRQYLAVATSRFTTYGLMTTPSWRDEFADGSGLNLAEPNNVTLIGSPDKRALVLENAPGSGSAVSQPITPTTAIARWGSLTFIGTVEHPTTTLTVDVLSLDGSGLLTDVVSMADLDGLDPAQYPSLKLRANLSSMVTGETPALDQWQLTWQVEEHRVYLPLIMTDW